jgi:hypothetical protein
VSAYIARQEKAAPGFRLNFFVDEVGQYIADNIKLMTNLQTLAESLNTRCRGRAWVLVTAQQDMNAVIGDMTQQQAHDFSKIHGAASREPHAAQQRRRGRGDPAPAPAQDRGRGRGSLRPLSIGKSTTSRRCSISPTVDPTMGNVRDREHFIHSYPFMPYQYPLFQMAIQELSRHNAFEGRHSSVGERSMLGVFQEVAPRAMMGEPWVASPPSTGCSRASAPP